MLWNPQGKLVVIAGPCLIEGKQMIEKVAKFLRTVADENPIYPVLKGSYEKANRTSGASYRGIGINKTRFDMALGYLVEAGKKYNLPTISDYHESAEMQRARTSMVQVPAFLCRQTRLLEEAAKVSDLINLKRGQFANAEVMFEAIFKVKAKNPRAKVFVTERGSTWGDNRLIPDFETMLRLRTVCDGVFYDVTHTVERGLAQLPMAWGAVAAGADGLYVEVHPNLDKARSDVARQLDFWGFRGLIEKAVKIKGATQ